MPIEAAQTVQIQCDNPSCPGTTLSSSDRTGWLIVTSEVYGQPVHTVTVCSAKCLLAVATTRAKDFGWDKAGSK